MRWLVLLAIAAAGCRVLSQEEQLLTRFFETARLHDTTVLAKYATVTFNPRTEGVVRAFDVERVETVDDASKRVTIEAQVAATDGQMVERTLVVTMRRQDDGWIISEIR